MKFKAKCIKSKLKKYHLNIQKFIELMTLKLLNILEIQHEDFNLFLINLLSLLTASKKKNQKVSKKNSLLYILILLFSNFEFNELFNFKLVYAKIFNFVIA